MASSIYVYPTQGDYDLFYKQLSKFDDLQRDIERFYILKNKSKSSLIVVHKHNTAGPRPLFGHTIIHIFNHEHFNEYYKNDPNLVPIETSDIWYYPKFKQSLYGVIKFKPHKWFWFLKPAMELRVDRCYGNNRFIKKIQFTYTHCFDKTHNRINLIFLQQLSN